MKKMETPIKSKEINRNHKIDNNPDIIKITNPWKIVAIILGIVTLFLLYTVYLVPTPTTNTNIVSGEEAGKNIADFLSVRTGAEVVYLDHKDLGNKIGGVTRQGVSLYIIRSGQNEAWRRSREYFERAQVGRDQYGLKRKKVISDIASQIEKCGLKNASKLEKFVYTKTKEYFSGRRFDRRAYYLDQVSGLFEDYYRSLNEGTKKSLEKLGKGNGLHFVIVSNILKAVGLKPLVFSNYKKRVITSRSKKESLERGVTVELPVSDIAHFLEISKQVVSDFYISYEGNERRPKVKNYVKGFGRPSHSKILNFRSASEIYLARDMGYNMEDIFGMFDKDKKVVDYAFEHEEEISEHIVSQLKVLFPDKDVRNPYVDFSID